MDLDVLRICQFMLSPSGAVVMLKSLRGLFQGAKSNVHFFTAALTEQSRFEAERLGARDDKGVP